MLKVLSTNIVSPLGMTTKENYLAVRSGKSAIRCHENWRGVPSAFAASLFSPTQIGALKIDGYSLFESIAIRSSEQAISEAGVDLRGDRTLFVLSTTKADVGQLGPQETMDDDYHRPAESAERIAARLGISGGSAVVCNACISGVNAQILAARLLSSGRWDNAVVCGADLVTPFVVSGFLSFKSLSCAPCRPFDIERDGLNLGEAAATIVFTREENPVDGQWLLVDGAMDNDAHHVSAPSPKGTGAVQVIQQVMKGRDASCLAFVNAHGTATMFNDQMESVAVQGAGLDDVPLTALKGWYGHTLGASGILESIISMMSVESGEVLPVRGYATKGVSGKTDISDQIRTTDKCSFLKMISGFGGCNGALVYTKKISDFQGCDASGVSQNRSFGNFRTLHSVQITPEGARIDGKPLQTQSTGHELLTEIYRNHIGDCPKYFKMDAFGRLVFLAAELLLRHEDIREDTFRSVILFNRTTSVVSDRSHISTIADPDNFYPSPSVFLYTLPNIVTGEIAIRHQCHGETALYITESPDTPLVEQIVLTSAASMPGQSMICGWADCESSDSFMADIRILEKMTTFFDKPEHNRD